MNKLGLIICTWSDVANISRKLAVDISKKGRPDLVVGIPRVVLQQLLLKC